MITPEFARHVAIERTDLIAHIVLISFVHARNLQRGIWFDLPPHSLTTGTITITRKAVREYLKVFTTIEKTIV